MPVARSTAVVLGALAIGAPALARADGGATAAPDTRDDQLDLRLTLSSFFYRESGNDASPLVDQGAAVQNASPIRRVFGDMRFELTGDGLVVDARLRQTTSERYQSGADGGAEYELRALAYR